MRLDIARQLDSYRGYLEWDEFEAYTSDGVSVVYPKISIELYLKSETIPVRKPKVTEINTLPTRDPMGDFDIRAQAVFYGASEILQTQLTGWMITPLGTVDKTWDPKGIDTSGNIVSLNDQVRIGNVCYPEIVSAFIEGRMNVAANGMGYRKDPDRYITPHGQEYIYPIIGSYDWTFTQNRKKQTFNMTLWLDK